MNCIMEKIKKSIVFPVCFFILMLGSIVGISYNRNPYLINIQYQSQADPEQDGVEKILVSHIQGVRNCTAENFEYNVERDRYEYVISSAENTYLNLYLNPLRTFRCDLEYRLKYEDSLIDHSDGIVVTLYKGNQPISQQFFSLINRDPTYKYQPELYMAAFLLLFFGSFIFIMVCILQTAWKRKSHLLIAQTVMTGIWSLLWVGGIKTNAMLEEVVFCSFAIFIAFCIVFWVIVSVFWNRSTEGKVYVMDTLKRIGFSILFLVITCCIYTPSSLFLGNINEFVMPYHRIAGLIFLYGFVVFMAFLIIGMSIRSVKGQYVYSLFLFFLAMGFYVQSNFLNPPMPNLNGDSIDWSQFTGAETCSRIGWGCLCLILFVLAVLGIWEKIKIEKPLRYLAVLFSLMQLCSLVVLIITCRVDPGLCQMLNKQGQFTVGDDNVIVFVVDCLQVDAVETYLENTPDAEDTLRDFTLFTNTVGGGSPTAYAVPVLLTGEEYDAFQDLDEYYNEIWQEGYLLKNLQEEKYDVRLYTGAELVRGIPSELVQNIDKTSGNKINNNGRFLRKICRLTNLYIMPLSLKEKFWLDTEEIKGCLIPDSQTTDETYDDDNIHFYEELQQHQLRKQNGKTFRLYHFWGVHQPFENDENLNRVTNNETDEERTFQGVMLILQEYIDGLKDLGIYDSSTIVILGDHGRHNKVDAHKYPAILVKRAGESHPLQYSDNPVCFRNFVATIGSQIKDNYTEYGPGLYDVTRESDVQRLHTIDRFHAMKYAHYSGELYADSETGARFIVDDDGEGNLTYREWNPYEINRILYNYGDVIDFRSSGSYADSLTERLYPAENGKTASNELTICFDLPEQKTGDLELGFTYAGVYNDTQKIRIYANGHKVDNVMCTTDQIGKEASVVIPKQYIKEKPVIIRMVFPNAVTPNQLDRSNEDMRVLSVTFDKMWLKVANS